MYDRDVVGYHSESEILLPRGDKFRVEEVRKSEELAKFNLGKGSEDDPSLTEDVYDIYLTYLP